MNKYNAKKTTIDGITFDSKKESERYCELKLRARDKNNPITGLELQPEFPCNITQPNGMTIKVCTYRADFRYIENGKTIIEDVKGVKTPVYKLKKKLVEALYGIKITET